MESLVILNWIRRLWPYIAGVSLLIGAYLYVDHQGYHRAAVEYQGKIAVIEAASAKAEAVAWKQKNDKEREYADKAQKADSDVAALRSHYAAVLLRYATDQRLRTASASSGNPPAIRSDGPSGVPELPPASITIPYKDAETCMENTVRLQKVQEWGLSILAGQSTSLQKQPSLIEKDSTDSTP